MPRKVRSSSDRIWKPWSLETHGVSPSFLELWLKCKYQCKLAYCDGWYSPSRNTAYYFIFGKAVHYLLEHYRFLIDKPAPRSRKCRRVLTELADQYYEENKKEFRSASNQQEINDMIALAVPTVNHYLVFYEDEENETDWIESELKIEIPYSYPDGKETIIKGYIDLIGRESIELDTGGFTTWQQPISSSNSIFKIRDSKTTGRVDMRAFKNAQPFSLQLNTYCLGFLYEFGFLPDEIVYDVIRRSGTKRKKSEKISEWTKGIESKMKLDPSHFFKRSTHNVNELEFTDWLNREFYPIMRDVRKWEESSFNCYPNPTAFYYDQSPSPFLDAILYGDFSNLRNKKDDSEEERAKEAAYTLLKNSKRKRRSSTKRQRGEVHR